MPYTPEQNGVIKRENRILVETARSMLHAKDVPEKLWAEAVNAAAYVLNRTGPTLEAGNSPSEIWFKTKPSVDHLKNFGTKCFIHIPKQKRMKFDKKTILLVIVVKKMVIVFGYQIKMMLCYQEMMFLKMRSRLQIQHLDDGSIFIHQGNYCRKILDSYNRSSANPVSVLFDKSLTCLDHSEKLQEDIPYRKAVGRLIYIAVVSRPDIAYSVGVLSRVLDKQSKVHWCLVKKVLKYLKGTSRCGILYQSNSAFKLLEAFSDADDAGDVSTRKSTSGMVFKFSGGAITWASKHQSCISLSATENGFVAASQACKEAIWLYRLFMEIHHLHCVPVLQVYNQSTIRLKNPEFHNRTRYIH
ncbi:Retrovirus-related Pol polyprotein from transposon TNT 1-94 [Araneus ventricosus]|uniref:Retrovirus-related Pol polyprotein from transposon TNT 1-94 n=1 Tax=Araneus ventricosus TaxID=182803 RepID=A0A4Y2R5S3_ARAVE|nr:Retrovirus-related Pol polyprotein from transposon TNT 1-94 [Araneus ventricosus]